MMKDMEISGPACQRAYLRDIASPPRQASNTELLAFVYNEKKLEAQEGGLIKNPLPTA